MSNNTKTTSADFDGYNNERNNRPKLFNTRKVFTESISPITEQQKEHSEQLRAALIKRTTMSRIAEFINAKLTRLNREHPGIAPIDESNYYERYLSSIENFNSTVDKMDVLINGEDATKELIDSVKVKMPNTKRPITRYECTAAANNNDFLKGTFILEVS